MYFIGQVNIFAGNFAPRNTDFCSGQLIAISSNSALFSILGTTYGGDGRTTFALPDLRARTPLGEGSGPGLTSRRLGSRGGTQSVGLTQSTLPSHTHSIVATPKATSAAADGGTSADGEYFATSPDNFYAQAGSGTEFNNMKNGTAQATLGTTGGGQLHNNLSPLQTVNFIIQLFGIYPSR